MHAKGRCSLHNLWVLFVAVICHLHLSAAIEYRGRKYVSEGDTFTITCFRAAFGANKWIKDGIQIIQNEENNITMTQKKIDVNRVIMSLRVESASWSDRGEYKCDPFNKDYHRIEVVPSVETDEMRRPQSVLLTINETLGLYCPDLVVSNDVFNINWYKDGHRISKDKDSRFSLNGRILTLEYPTEEDTGVYFCTVEGNGLSYPTTDHNGYEIQVTYGARVQPFPSQMRPILGRNFTLECKVHGYPVPRVTWFVDGIPGDEYTMNNSKYSILDNDEGLPNAVLLIEDVTFDDIKIITCEIDNMHGTMRTSVLLAVRETMINTNEDEPGAGIQLIPGTDLILQCNTTDDPDLDVSWSKNGERLNMTDSRIIVENFNNTLTINQVTEADTGNYTCTASTKMGSVNATIAVRTKVKLISFDSSRNIVQGQNIVLQCNVTQGTLPVNLQWLKDGIPLNLSDSRIEVENDHRGILDAKVTIKDAEFEDRAEYTCVATNFLGQANTTILVRVKDKYAALWPFLGICAEVTILCAIIFVYEKRRQKPEFDESEGDHATENKTVSDQEEKSHDIRQRK